MITELTAEQQAKIPDYVKKWIAIGMDTNECDFEKSKEYIAKIYQVVDLEPPKKYFGPYNNPLEGAIATHVILKRIQDDSEIETADWKSILAEIDNMIANYKDISKDDWKSIRDQLYCQVYGNHDASWLSFYDFILNEVKLDCCKVLENHMELAKHCCWWTPLTGMAILQHKPLEIHMNANNVLHNTEGAAIKFRGIPLCDVYAVRGVRVPKKVIDRDYTVQDIDAERNVEVRRIMIELYGQAKYLLDSKAEVVHVDDFGTLYRKEQENDEPIMMVKVVNSTPEPDGSFKDYFIRVAPNAYGGLKTAKAAVASTWRNADGSMVFEDPSDYNPEIET